MKETIKILRKCQLTVLVKHKCRLKPFIRRICELVGLVPDMPVIPEIKFVSAYVGLDDVANVVTLRFDALLDAINYLPETSSFTVNFSGGAVTVDSLMVYDETSIDKYQVALTLSRLITAGETGTVTFTRGTSPYLLRGDDGRLVENFSSKVITNAVSSHINDFTEVVIGSQTWMKYNLVEGGSAYDDDDDNRGIYGGLYTYDQAVTLAAGISGWHLPTKTEWETLLALADSYGQSLKSIDSDRWNDVIGHTDSQGLSVLGAGVHAYGVGYIGIKEYSSFMTATEDGDDNCYGVTFYKNSDGEVYIGSDLKTHKVSVRLIKD